MIYSNSNGAPEPDNSVDILERWSDAARAASAAARRAKGAGRGWRGAGIRAFQKAGGWSANAKAVRHEALANRQREKTNPNLVRAIHWRGSKAGRGEMVTSTVTGRTVSQRKVPRVIGHDVIRTFYKENPLTRKLSKYKTKKKVY
jgi:hypothetical protein